VRDKNTMALDAMHSIKEEAFRMKECLLRGDFALLHSVLRSSWESKKRMASQIPTNTLERLYASALDAGAYCAKISGAGGRRIHDVLTDPSRKTRWPLAARPSRRRHGLRMSFHGRWSAGLEGAMRDVVRDQLAEAVASMQAVARDSTLHATLAEAAQATASALKAGRKLMVAGNAAAPRCAAPRGRVCQPACRKSCSHARCGPHHRYVDLTAIGNDYGFERLFARQIEALGKPGDVFIGISTSGKSPNILGALELCRQMALSPSA